MSKKVIEAQNVDYKYPDGYRAIKNISLYVKEGEKLGRKNEKRNVIKNLHKLNIPIEQIAQAVELTEKEVEEILKEK